MNINLIAMAKQESAAEKVASLTGHAVAYAKDIFGTAQDHLEQRGRVWIYNADRMARTWRPPTWFTAQGVQYGVSQPPVPTDQETSAEELPNIVHDRVWGQSTPRGLLMNHWGYGVHADGRARVWTDLVGFGRCYVVETAEIIAVSNHIGVLAFFLGRPLEIDDKAVALFCNFGWFTADTTPFRGVNRVPRATFIDLFADGSVKKSVYLPLAELVGEREAEPDFDAVVQASRLAARNLDQLSIRTPTVYLSGGQDSRMTAGLWLSGGSAANVMTMGTLEQEAHIATELMSKLGNERSLAANGVVHKITEPKPSGITMTLEDRLSTAHKMWDGDAAPTNMKRDLRVPTGAAALTIGGTNGEITHGYFYSKPGQLELIQRLEHPLKRLGQVFAARNGTALVRDQLDHFFEHEYEVISSAGSPGIPSTDVFYFREKLRRWHNQSLNTSSVVLLGSEAYIRMAFDLSIEQRIEKVAPKTIARTAVPAWDGVPYYKATVGEAKVATSKGLRIWLTDPELFNEVLDHPRIWDRYLDRAKITAFRELIPQGEAVGSHESWFNRALWVDSLDLHREQLHHTVQAAGAY
ncbi:hypothetical protein [Kocuria salsicia]|uniref:hypothetical protein n=1 Tax=Kocuria salsicia TaxID=664639 RepID=UPI0011A09E18|nr:hypothetical protein [Kocuria salsicia]